jgi:lysine 2,3-aminomutase
VAGAKGGVFVEKLGPFLKKKLEEARKANNKSLIHAIESQYLVDPREGTASLEQNRRHYEAETMPQFEGQPLKGLERLYRRTILVEPTTVCAAHCRWCLRGQYDIFNLRPEELERIARFIGSGERKENIREILITGGDPLLVVNRLKLLIDRIIEHAPQVQIIRIGTRIPTQDPARINKELIRAITPRSGVIIELGVHVNHPAELFQESRDAFKRISEAGVKIYDQTVLLKDLNDDKDVLLELFDELRYLNIECHYLFHAIPMAGMAHYRTSVDTGLSLIRQIVNSGQNTGRAKPLYTAMTDIGKITFYDGTIIKREANRLLLQSNYTLEDRLKWNPDWKVPGTVEFDSTGNMRVWYLDQDDD